MDIKTWRNKHKTTCKALAGAIGVSEAYLWRIEAGRQLPSWDLVARIHEVTGGAVSADDFMPSTTVAKKPQTQVKVL